MLLVLFKETSFYLLSLIVKKYLQIAMRNNYEFVQVEVSGYSIKKGALLAP